MLNQETISLMLPNVTVVTYDVTDSTNTRAIELAETDRAKASIPLPKAAYISQLLFVLRAI